MDDQPIDAAAWCARGGSIPEFETPTSSPPLYLSTAFDIANLDQLDAVAAGRVKGYIYTRDQNPNHEAFARDVAALERAESGFPFASGMGGLMASLASFVGHGDHIIAARALYGRTMQLLNRWQEAFGATVTFVDVADPAAVARARTENTKLVIVESISNPLVEVVDLAAVAAACGNTPLLVDNTFATPCLTRPMEHGASLVWHSASKYLNGHGDVMLGVVVGHERLMRQIRATASLFGVNANPFECWLGSRGLRTLPLRIERVSQTASQLAKLLSQHQTIARVYYPGLESHPTHAIARRQMVGGFGGMLSMDLRGGRTAIDHVMRALAHRIPFSPTLADARTTLSYPAATSHKFMSAAERTACGVTDGILRLSVGLEGFEYLAAELTGALDSLPA